MSREDSAFAILGGLATLSAVAAWLSPLKDFVPMLAIATALLGGISVFTSAMIYVDTHRDFWSARLTFPKFFGTALLLGTTTAAAVLSVFPHGG
jgi:DMSO reductase anchor subunit